MRSLLILSLLRESGEQPAHLVQLDVLLGDLVLQPSRVTVDCLFTIILNLFLIADLMFQGSTNLNL